VSLIEQVQEFLSNEEIPGAQLDFFGNVQSAKTKALEEIAASLGVKVIATNGQLFILRKESD
jgi:RNA-binding protein YhbY